MLKDWQVHALKELRASVSNTILWPEEVLEAERHKVFRKLEGEAIDGHWKEFYIQKLAILKDETEARVQKRVRVRP